MTAAPFLLPADRPATAQQALRTVLERLEAYLKVRPGEDGRAALAALVDAWEQWRMLRGGGADSDAIPTVE